MRLLNPCGWYGYRFNNEGLNNPTNDSGLGIATSLAGEIIEPPVNLLGIGGSAEGLNNPTSVRSMGIDEPTG